MLYKNKLLFFYCAKYYKKGAKKDEKNISTKEEI